MGFKGGLNVLSIQNETLPFSEEISWTAGLTTRSSYFDDFQFIYGINFYDFKTTLPGRTRPEYTEATEEIKFNMIAVQVNFFASYKILGHHLSVEAGPVVQVNGELEPQLNQEYFYVTDYDLQAKDLQKVSAFNFNLAVGLSGGFERVKFWGQYQYGLNNFLNRLNDENLDALDPRAKNFQGNINMISGGVVVFL